MEKINKINHRKLTWINIVNPKQDDIDYLEDKFDFHHLDFEDCLTTNQRAKIDRYDDYLFLILHLPVQASDGSIASQELDIFVTDNTVITLHKNIDVLNELFENARNKIQVQENLMSKSPGYLVYTILNSLYETGFTLLDSLTAEASELEKEVFDIDLTTDKLKDILALKKDLINFRRIILPQRSVIAQLEHIYMGDNQNEDLEVYFDNIVDKIEKIYSILENQKEIVASLQETNEAIIFHNTNNIIRVLTVFSVIMMPLSVITGFFGMNVDLPIAKNPVAYFAILIFMLAVLAVMLIFFRFKKWL